MSVSFDDFYDIIQGDAQLDEWLALHGNRLHTIIDEQLTPFGYALAYGELDLALHLVERAPLPDDSDPEVDVIHITGSYINCVLARKSAVLFIALHSRGYRLVEYDLYNIFIRLVNRSSPMCDVVWRHEKKRLIAMRFKNVPKVTEFIASRIDCTDAMVALYGARVRRNGCVLNAIPKDLFIHYIIPMASAHPHAWERAPKSSKRWLVGMIGFIVSAAFAIVFRVQNQVDFILSHLVFALLCVVLIRA